MASSVSNPAGSAPPVVNAASDDMFEVRDKVVAFSNYEDYLDSQVSELDMFYLEDEDLARQLIGEWYKCSRPAGSNRNQTDAPLVSRLRSSTVLHRQECCLML
jgi:Domain of unknown function (DUF4464)